MTPSPVPTAHRRRWLLLAAGGLVAAALGAAMLLRIATAENFTSRLPLPGRVDTLTERDGFAYPLHVAFASAIDRIGGPPNAAGIQWLKAAWHARSEQELTHAAEGLATSRRRAGNASELDARVCALIASTSDPQARRASALAGFTCTPR